MGHQRLWKKHRTSSPQGTKEQGRSYRGQAQGQSFQRGKDFKGTYQGGQKDMLLLSTVGPCEEQLSLEAKLMEFQNASIPVVSKTSISTRCSSLSHY